MSKIECTCGNFIFDSSDFMGHKAYFLADQDHEDFFNEIEKKEWHKIAVKASAYFREIFQCANCNNIIFVTAAGRFDFTPIDKEHSSKVLISYRGQEWPGTMSANFRDGKGELFWQTNKESEYIRDMKLAELKEKYFQKFEELRKLNILRHSFLNINGNMEHQFEAK